MSIRTALEARLAGWVAAQTPVPKVAYQNAAFTPPALDVTYLRAFLMPATRYGKTLCSVEESGIYQVSVYAKANGGTTPAESIAESICTHFAPGMYAGFQILSPPYFSQGFNVDDGRYMVPVTINYRASP